MQEVPRRQPESQNAQAEGHQSVVAMANLPATPEGNGGCHDHQNSAKWIQNRLPWLTEETILSRESPRLTRAVRVPIVG